MPVLQRIGSTWARPPSRCGAGGRAEDLPGAVPARTFQHVERRERGANSPVLVSAWTPAPGAEAIGGNDHARKWQMHVRKRLLL